ncbi:LysE family translocator [Novispirillum itersonii]|uniref:Threonine/homoserine/homoserine lactone efflux protein n=1 Tax=Novispirillum itersonii TaxID=189 RepID=A0A7X0DK92_NOVIT|nr:LysE family translocator [Novispirillum itersonii]MBB6208713.1 threonine/homoserine/homoserine lactone efflux protein [Novispirillum itersonii]
MTGLQADVLGAYALSVIAMIIIPGPVALLVTGAGLAGGQRRALRTIAGTNLASLVLIALSALMVQGVLTVNDLAFAALKLAGAAYIAVMGREMLRSRPAPAPDGAGTSPAVGGFRRGFVIAVSNPKDIIFFASFFPQFMTVLPDSLHSLTLLTAVWIVLDFATLLLMAVLVQRLLRPSVQAVTLRLSGAVLLAVAVAGAALTVRDLL